MNKPKVVIFDYGNVLDIPDDWDAWYQYREALANEHGLTGQDLWNAVYYSEPWQQVKRGKISEQDYWNSVCAPLGYHTSEAQSAFWKRLWAGRDRIHPQMLSLLHTLRPHYRLAILSNAYQWDMETWLAKERGVPGLFDVVISSARVGMAKPDPEIYHLTLERIGVAGHEAIFVDDLERNTSVAEAEGLPCILFTSPEQLKRELVERGILPVQQQA
ncbi:MAG: HAD family phosphatase [Anaerolineae bacterium]|nr:HAD family phosphatase [Anaerolineae bacterium]